MSLGISKEFIEFQNEILGFVSVSWQEKCTTYPVSWRVVRGMPPYLLSTLSTTPFWLLRIAEFSSVAYFIWHLWR